MSIYKTPSISPKTLSNSPLKGENPKSPFKGDLEGLLRERQGGSESSFKGDLEGLLRERQEGLSLPFRGPRKIFDFWGGFWEI